MCTWQEIAAQYKSKGLRGFPNYREKEPTGASSNRHWATSACPIAGGNDRLKIYYDGTTHSGPHIWCHACGMWYRIPETRMSNTSELAPIEVPQPIDATDVLKFHEQLGGRAGFFLSRGIAKAWIDVARLGWTAESERKKWRYSIPCFDPAFNLWAVQYRHRDANYKGDFKYISEAKGTNNRLFVPPYYVLDKLPYVVIDESPLDALTWCSLGIPAIAPFSGGRVSRPWRDEWTSWLPERVIFVAQNDGGFGVDVAVARYLAVGRGHVIEMDGAKDVSGMVQRGLDPVAWLGMPVVEQLLTPKWRNR